MTVVPIPTASLERLRTTFSQFEQLAQVVAEAMGIDPQVRYRLDLRGGAFVVGEDDGESSPNGHAAASESTTPAS